MRPLVLTFVDRNYIPVGRNWLRAVSGLGIDAEMRLVALDAETRAAIPGEATLYRPSHGEGYKALLQRRIGILCEALEQGRTVIHSDADAVWLRDPLGEFEACGTEMVFTQGTVWPPDIHARHGVVLCCGLFYARSTPQVRAFMAAVGKRVAADRSDQIGVNRLADAHGIRWTVRDPYQVAFRDTAFTASREPILSEGGSGPSIAVLPHHRFPRLIDRVGEDVVVAHPLSDKTCAGKREALSQLGLWEADEAGPAPHEACRARRERLPAAART